MRRERMSCWVLRDPCIVPTITLSTCIPQAWKRLSREGRRGWGRGCSSYSSRGLRVEAAIPVASPPSPKLHHASLNRQQRLAIEAPETCVRVVAGPGSGKTLVLTQRILHLILQKGILPSRILCITFTNKAADELRQRIGGVLGTSFSKELKVETFHSFCVQLLRVKPHSGISRNFVIYDEQDCERLLKSIIQLAFMVIHGEIDLRKNAYRSLHTLSKHLEEHESTMLEAQSPNDKLLKFHVPFQKMLEMGFFDRASAEMIFLLNCIKSSEGGCNTNGEKKRFKIPSDEVKRILSQISKVRTLLMKEFIADKRCMDVPNLPKSVKGPIIKLTELYQLALRENNAVDFDDMIHLAVQGLHEDHAFKLECQEKWESILVDEFQDTDVVQYELVQLLAKEHKNLFVVGDIDQAIYGWRGADSRHMQVSLKHDFSELATYKLERNYRSSENILRAASVILDHCRYDREMGSTALRLIPTKGSGEPIVIGKFQTCDEEAKFVVSEIQNLVRKHLASWRSFAIMYRTHCQSFPLEAALAKAQVPYMTIGKLPFYSHKEIKIMAYYLQLIASLDNEVAIEYCINIPPRGIGEKTMIQLRRWAVSNNLSLPQALKKIYEESTPMRELGIRSKARDAVVEYLHLITELSSFSLQASVPELVEELCKRLKLTNYVQKLGDSNSAKIRLQRLEQFMLIARGYNHQVGKQALINFLEGLSLASIQEGKELKNEDNVKLITMHASKGMEFESVFLIGALDGIIPHASNYDDEERRLFYVGITRAKERLYLTCHCNSYQYSISKPELSRFIVEIYESLPRMVRHITC